MVFLIIQSNISIYHDIVKRQSKKYKNSIQSQFYGRFDLSKTKSRKDNNSTLSNQLKDNEKYWLNNSNAKITSKFSDRNVDPNYNLNKK